MEINIRRILSLQLIFVMVFAVAVFAYTIILEGESISESVQHGEEALDTCFDEYLESIKTIGVAFIKDISRTLSDHVGKVAMDAETKTRAAVAAVERTRFLDALADNEWHGSRLLPSFGWQVLAPLQEQEDDVIKSAVVADIVIASMNATEETNTWAWFGLASRNPNRDMDCDFLYYRNATNASSSLWCLQDLYEEPSQPSPSVWPHLTSPAIYKLQNATPRELVPAIPREDDVAVVAEENTPRPILWMPLNFFVWTNNKVALTSVVGGVFGDGPDGTKTLKGFAASNVRFTSMAKYLSALVGSARYENLNIALMDTQSGKILGSSLGEAIYSHNVTGATGEAIEQQLPGGLGEMDDSPLAQALHRYIEDSYGGLEQIPTPLTTSAYLMEGQEYFISFDTFSRPMMDLTICVLLPVVSITGPTDRQRYDAQIRLEDAAQEVHDETHSRRVGVIIFGVCGLLACALIASLTSVYLSSRIGDLVTRMEGLRKQIKDLVRGSRRGVSGGKPSDLCEILPEDFFPVPPATCLKDLNKIQGATKDLCNQFQSTWNSKQNIFREALEQRQFTASIAHDIKNPLHGVLGIVGMMQSDLEENKDKLPLLADTLKHMSILLNDMVDLSKIQGGKVTAVSAEFDAFNTLKEVQSLYEETVASKGGTLSCMDRCSLPLANCDPVHVQRIVTNFVSNASKYAPGAEIILKAIVATREEVETLKFLHHLGTHFTGSGGVAPHWAENTPLLDDEEYIVLACLDKGQGIPPEKLDGVFEAYQQTRTSHRGQGAGLGLAIVKGLAIEMGGGIGVQSQLSSGSLFWLVIRCSQKKLDDLSLEKLSLDKKPLFPTCANGAKITPPSSKSPLFSISTTPPTPVQPPKEQHAIPPGAEQGMGGGAHARVDDDSGGKYHVLVVDDVNLNLMLLSHFIKKLGYTCDKSTTAEDGLSKLRQDPEKFDLIISDFNMPEMSGGEMCLAIRKDPNLCHLPFVCSSGNQMTQDEKETYQIDETLTKPFTVDKLRDTIVPFLGRPSEWSFPRNNPGAPEIDEAGAFTITPSTSSKSSPTPSLSYDLRSEGYDFA